MFVLEGPSPPLGPASRPLHRRPIPPFRLFLPLPPCKPHRRASLLLRCSARREGVCAPVWCTGKRVEKILEVWLCRVCGWALVWLFLLASGLWLFRECVSVLFDFDLLR